MEFYSKKQPDHLKLIKGIFYLILGSATLATILLFTLSINRKASVTDGEIISQNAPIKYLAPNDAMISSINIKEGDRVMAGDKIIILTNAKLEQERNKKKRKLEATKESLKFHKRVLSNLKRKMKKQSIQLDLLTNSYKNEKEGTLSDLGSIDNQLSNYEEKIKISQNRIVNLEKLYKDGGISGNEYDKLYKNYLDELNRLISYRNQVSQKRNKFDRIDIEKEQDENKLSMTLLKAEADYLKKVKDIDDDEREIEELKLDIENANQILEGLVLRATIDGYITDLFTTKLKTIFIKKDQMLCILNPLVEEELFAKVVLKEEEIKDIVPGQEVHLRFPAFNHYQYGVLHGQVRHVNKEVIEDNTEVTEPKEHKGNFYALVQIPESEAAKFNLKSGFKVNGDIILNRVKLYRFIFESMFTK